MELVYIIILVQKTNMNKSTTIIMALVAAAIVGTIGVQLAPQPVHAQSGGCASAGAGSGGAAAGATNSASGQTCGAGAGATTGICIASAFFEETDCAGA